MNAHAYEGNQNAEDDATEQGVAKHLTGFAEVVGTNKVCHLYRKTSGKGTQQATDKPCGGLDEAYACRSLCTQMAHHRSVDEEHHDCGNLCQHGGNTQPHDEVELLAAVHGASRANRFHQIFCLFAI